MSVTLIMFYHIDIEVMHKVWYYASAVKDSHFEWLIMYTGVTS